jgi:hypothetical protein
MSQRHASTNAASTTVEMVEQDLRQTGKMNWWYRFAAPPQPSSAAPFSQREAYRRGKLISLALLLQLVIVIVLLPTVGVFVNHALIPNLAIMVVLLSIAVMFNRGGRIIPAGILAVVGLDLSLMLNLASYPAMTSFLLPLLDLLVLPELFAVSLLPPVAVFVDALVHICFIVASLLFLFPKSAELQALLQTSSLQDALARPIVIQVLVAVVTYLWVKSALQAIERADRATSIAILEREMAEQGMQVTAEKQQLEESIRQILAVHTRVANGNYTVRVPLTRGNVLWEIGGALNNLLNRLQRYRQDTLIFEQTNLALNQFLQARSRAQNGFISWQPTNTPVDVLVQQHNGFVQSARLAQTLDAPDAALS